MKTSLRQPCPHWGRGRIAVLLYSLYRKFLHDYIQVIRHYRNWGMPDRRGRSLHSPAGPCRFEELEEFFKAPEGVMINIKCFLQSTFLKCMMGLLHHKLLTP
jgi:hypothetical protein